MPAAAASAAQAGAGGARLKPFGEPNKAPATTGQGYAKFDVEEGPIRYCPPNDNCKNMWTGKVVEARLPITRFVDGTVVYIVSKEITDLLSIYIFHIKPLPGCGSDAAAANATGLALPASCEAAPSAEQFNFAGIILLLGAAMIGLFKDDKAGGAIIPSMMGMSAGWTLASAFIEWVQEHTLATFGCRTPHDCPDIGTQEAAVAYNLWLVAASMCVSGFATVLFKPCARHIELGDSKWADWCENTFEALWKLVFRAVRAIRRAIRRAIPPSSLTAATAPPPPLRWAR